MIIALLMFVSFIVGAASEYYAEGYGKHRGQNIGDFEWDSFKWKSPPRPGIYKVLRLNCINGSIYETDSKWNGADWLTLSDKKEITPQIYFWRCY